MDQLSFTQQMVLRVGAVFGRTFDFSPLCRCFPFQQHIAQLRVDCDTLVLNHLLLLRTTNDNNGLPGMRSASIEARRDACQWNSLAVIVCYIFAFSFWTPMFCSTVVTMEFVSDAIQETAYRSLTNQQRADLHRAIGGLLLQERQQELENAKQQGDLVYFSFTDSP